MGDSTETNEDPETNEEPGMGLGASAVQKSGQAVQTRRTTSKLNAGQKQLVQGLKIAALFNWSCVLFGVLGVILMYSMMGTLMTRQSDSAKQFHGEVVGMTDGSYGEPAAVIKTDAGIKYLINPELEVVPGTQIDVWGYSNYNSLVYAQNPGNDNQLGAVNPINRWELAILGSALIAIASWKAVASTLLYRREKHTLNVQKDAVDHEESDQG